MQTDPDIARDKTSHAPTQAPEESTACAAAVTTLSPDHGPDVEPGADGPDVAECVREALDRLAAVPARGEGGRFVAGGLAAGKTLERSEAFWSAVAPIKSDLVARVSADGAAQVDAAETLRGLRGAYAEVRLFREAMFLRLVEQGGPITAKGKARALYTAYLNALDRETKLAQLLGLQRAARDLSTMSAAEWAARQGAGDGR